MIVNIIDCRKRQYRFMKINAVVEAAWHDNTVKDSDQVIERGNSFYEGREHVTYAKAIEWGNSFSAAVTMFVYDEDGEIYAKRRSRIHV